MLRKQQVLKNDFSLDSRKKEKKHVYSIFSFVLAFLLLFSFSILPLEFCHAIGTPSYFDSRVYPQGLVDEGSVNAGQKNSEAEFAFLPTSEWTTLSANLQTGNFMVLAPLVTVQGVPNSLSIFLTYNHFNASVDIGVGKGWMTNLHACVEEDSQTNDLTYVTATGAKLAFTYAGPSTPYINPSGFVGEAEKNGDGTYTITPLGEGSLTFDSTGKLTTLSNRCDDGEQTVSYTSGRPTAITDSLSDRAITLTWNESGKLTGITDSMSHSWTLGYSQAGDDLTSITQPVASTPPNCEFSYDANHKMETHTDFLGSVYEIDYIASGDHAGKLYSVTDPNEHVTSFAYAVNVDGYAKQTILTDAEDRDTAYYFGSTSGHRDGCKSANHLPFFGCDIQCERTDDRL